MTTKKYKVLVHYDKSVKELVKDGKYDDINSNITGKNFPFDESCGDKECSTKESLDIYLLNFKRDISSEKILKIIEKRGYRVCNLKELLSLGAQYPDLQRKDYIVALGSQWQGPFGSPYVPYLGGHDSYRHLSLTWLEGDWSSGWQFACLKVESNSFEPLHEEYDKHVNLDPFTLTEVGEKLDLLQAGLEGIQERLNNIFK
jgi:hypothetical protein